MRYGFLGLGNMNANEVVANRGNELAGRKLLHPNDDINMVGKVVPENGKLKVQASDLLDNRQLHIDADMVVLAAAIEPDESARPLATMLTASMDTNNFFTEAHPKLRPVESPTAGIFLSGACQGPKDIPETVAQAGAAASKAIGLLSKDHLTCNPCVAEPDELMTLLFSMLDYLGIEKERTRVEWVSAAEGGKFAATMNEFVQTVTKLGPNRRLEDLRCSKD